MSEQSNFEKGWKDAFEGAEMAPASKVWSNIRADVASSQVVAKSKQVVYWRWLAAASVLLLMTVGVGTVFYYESMTDEFDQLSQQEEKLKENIALLEVEKNEKQNYENENKNEDSNTENGSASVAQLEEDTQSSKEQLISSKMNDDTDTSNIAQQVGITSSNSDKGQDAEVVESNKAVADKEPNVPKENIGTISKKIKKSTTFIAVDMDRPQQEQIDNNVSQDILISESIDNGVLPDNLDKNEKTPLAATDDLMLSKNRISRLIAKDVDILAGLPEGIIPQKVPDYMEIVRMQNGGAKEQKGMWAGFSLGGGSYDANSGQGEGNALSFSADQIENLDLSGQPSLTNANQLDQSSTETSSFSYTIGADFGKKIGKRTYLQSGVEYNRYASEATSNISIANASNAIQSFLRVNNSTSLDDGTLMATSPYTVSNNFQYVSIPLRMGYQLIDKKIGLSISSGISTNLFLKNTLKDQSGDRSNVEITNSDNSPYKPVNFNGILGMELSYQWNDYYQLALVPDYRVSLDGITKTDAFFQSSPKAFFLGFRFKYILK